MDESARAIDNLAKHFTVDNKNSNFAKTLVHEITNLNQTVVMLAKQINELTKVIIDLNIKR